MITGDPGITSIEILGQNGEYLCVHGDGAGDRGVYLAEGQVTGIYDSPEKQVWKSGARQIGAKQKNRKILARDMDLGFLCKETNTHTAEENESYLVQAIGYGLDQWDDDARYARLRVTTDMSGWRDLDIVQYEEPDFSPKSDPIKDQLLNPILKLRSGSPDWYQDSVISSQTWTEDGWKEVVVENPTPRPMLHKWVATQGTWTIPDFSWRGGKGNRFPAAEHSERYIPCPALTPSDGGMVIDTDLNELMARSGNGTNILARFGGKFFKYSIPPYTQRQTLPVFCEDVPEGGATLNLVQPRRWPRPWGLELRA
jgi:hypothetical protein